MHCAKHTLSTTHPEGENAATQDCWAEGSLGSVSVQPVSLHALGLMITTRLQRKVMLTFINEYKAPE